MKKGKILLEITSFYTCVPKFTIIQCMVSEIRSGTDRIFCHYGPFLLFYPPNNLQNQSFENMKRALGDVIILHMCTKSDIHIMYGSRDMEHDRQNFLSF